MTSRLSMDWAELARPDPEPEAGIVWEESPCPLCGDPSPQPCFEAADNAPTDDVQSLAQRGYRFLVVRCPTCNLQFTNPRPDASCIERFYPADYKPHRRPAQISQATRPRAPLLERFLGRRCKERRGLLPWEGTGRLLDFGCGAGSFLKRMADQGWHVVGLDANVGAVGQIQQELGLRALAGSLPHPQLEPGSFEVITMWHSLEHVHQPLEVLREAYRLLVPGGKLIVAAPNIDSWPFRHFGTAWFGLDLPRHLVHFTPTTLTLALQTAGLRLCEMRSLRHSDWLRSSAAIARKAGSRHPILDRILTWKPAAKLTARVAYMLGQSDCMLAVAERPKF
jgi:2-polyprenyl-3-methyl-5-hydroxy-6-metoxy-1,4-benzoquinol methylase